MSAFTCTRMQLNLHTCPAKFPHVWKNIYARVWIYRYTRASKCADKYIKFQ